LLIFVLATPPSNEWRAGDRGHLDVVNDDLAG
jgi:hypothetical protein